VEVADVVYLRQREELVPVESNRILDVAPDLERPRGQVDRRQISKVQHRPVPHFVLTDRKARHAIAIGRA
jgi:hypothetical protein